MVVGFRKAWSPYQLCMASFPAQTAKFIPHFRGCGFITCNYKRPTIPYNLGRFPKRKIGHLFRTISAMVNQGNGDIVSLLHRLTEPLDSLQKDVESLNEKEALRVRRSTRCSPRQKTPQMEIPCSDAAKRRASKPVDWESSPDGRTKGTRRHAALLVDSNRDVGTSSEDESRETYQSFRHYSG